MNGQLNIEFNRHAVLKNAGTMVIASLSNKLIELDRRASGALMNSFESVVTEGADFVQVDILGLDYWRVVEYGVASDKVPYNPKVRTGAGSSLYIQGLINWLKTKGIGSSDPEQRGIAFAIAKKHTEVGITIDKGKLGFLRKTMPLIVAEESRLSEMFAKELDAVAESRFNKTIDF